MPSREPCPLTLTLTLTSRPHPHLLPSPSPSPTPTPSPLTHHPHPQLSPLTLTLTHTLTHTLTLRVKVRIDAPTEAAARDAAERLNVIGPQELEIALGVIVLSRTDASIARALEDGPIDETSSSQRPSELAIGMAAARSFFLTLEALSALSALHT